MNWEDGRGLGVDKFRMGIRQRIFRLGDRVYVCVTSSRCRELGVGRFDVSHEKLGCPIYCTTRFSYHLDGDEAVGHAGICLEEMRGRCVFVCVQKHGCARAETPQSTEPLAGPSANDQRHRTPGGRNQDPTLKSCAREILDGKRLFKSDRERKEGRDPAEPVGKVAGGGGVQGAHQGRGVAGVDKVVR